MYKYGVIPKLWNRITCTSAINEIKPKVLTATLNICICIYKHDAEQNIALIFNFLIISMLQYYRLKNEVTSNFDIWSLYSNFIVYHQNIN